MVALRPSFLIFWITCATRSGLCLALFSRFAWATFTVPLSVPALISENLFSITDKVNDNLKFEDRGHLAKLEQLINLKLPGIHITDEKTSGLFARFKNWINFSPVYNFNEITWRRNINAVLAHNMETAINPKLIKSKYEIYVVIMRMVVDKIGVDYLEIGIEKSFTDDLGVD